MPFIATKPVRVQPYFGWRSEQRLHLQARALRSRPPKFGAAGRWQALRTMIAQFASHEVEGLEVRLEWIDGAGERQTHTAWSDSEGYVRFDIALDAPWPLEVDTRWEVVSLHWDNREGEQVVDAHVLAPGTRAGLAVISDIDDTIIETGITGNLRAVARNWRRILLEMPEERLLVPGADVFYTALGGGAVLRDGEDHTGDSVPATRHPFFYVSSSPWNLFSYLVAFQRTRGLPLGPITMRDWGLNRDTFASSSHGAHKIAAIEDILQSFPDMPFALIGDDTQGDLTAFGDIVARHADRIRAVFIRKAGEAFSPEELEAKATIRAAGIPLWLGDAYKTGQDFLRAIGLDQDGEAEKIVEAVDAAQASKPLPDAPPEPAPESTPEPAADRG